MLLMLRRAEHRHGGVKRLVRHYEGEDACVTGELGELKCWLFMRCDEWQTMRVRGVVAEDSVM
jgi:hypothetical protein